MEYPAQPVLGSRLVMGPAPVPAMRFMSPPAEAAAREEVDMVGPSRAEIEHDRIKRDHQHQKKERSVTKNSPILG